MIYKNIEKEFGYILWLRERIKKLHFGVSRKVKTDSTEDFELLTRKLKSYQQEYNLVINELYSLLKDASLSEQIDNIGKESGTLSIRGAYFCGQEEKNKKEIQKTQ